MIEFAEPESAVLAQRAWEGQPSFGELAAREARGIVGREGWAWLSPDAQMDLIEEAVLRGMAIAAGELRPQEEQATP